MFLFSWISLSFLSLIFFLSLVVLHREILVFKGNEVNNTRGIKLPAKVGTRFLLYVYASGSLVSHRTDGENTRGHDVSRHSNA